MFKLSLALSSAFVAGQVTLQSYCALLSAQCPQHSMNASICEMAMAQTDVGTVAEVNVDSLECRVKFLNNPMFNNTRTNCNFAGPSGGGRCGAMVDTVCRVALDICGGTAERAYNDVAACTAAYRNPMDDRQDQWGSRVGASAGSEDTLECRVYHPVAGLNLNDLATHCAHFTADPTSANFACSQRVQPNVDQYCETLQRACPVTMTNNVAQFAEMAQCVTTAQGYPTGLTDDARPSNTGNTLGCRNYHAQAAIRDGAVHCQHAGPSGGGACGTRREAWASILKAAPCADPHVDMFISALNNNTLVDTLIPTGVVAGMSYSTTFDTSGNNQICRIYHLGVASVLPFGPTGHCTHGAVSGGGACGAIVPNLCKLIGDVCSFGTNASWQFADDAACRTGLTASATNNITLGLTKPQDVSGNTHECRFYHVGVAAQYLPGGAMGNATNALQQRILHCSHVLQVAAVNGCRAPTPGTAPTNAGTAPTARAPTNSAAALSASFLFLGVSVFAL